MKFLEVFQKKKVGLRVILLALIDHILHQRDLQNVLQEVCRNLWFKNINSQAMINRSISFPEKFIPTCILNSINNKSIPIYGQGKNVREWMLY